MALVDISKENMEFEDAKKVFDENVPFLGNIKEFIFITITEQFDVWCRGHIEHVFICLLASHSNNVVTGKIGYTGYEGGRGAGKGGDIGLSVWCHA